MKLIKMKIFLLLFCLLFSNCNYRIYDAMHWDHNPLVNKLQKLFVKISLSEENIKIHDAMISQYIDLEYNLQRLVEFTGIILIEPREYPIMFEKIDGIIIPNIVISKKLVPGFLERYKIAHYIRNRLSYFFYYEMDPYPPVCSTEVGKPYYFPGYEEYVKKNAELICHVIYHFFSEKYYGKYKYMTGLYYYLLIDELLDEHLELLYKKLENEISHIDDNLRVHGLGLIELKERHSKKRLDR